mgnify:CR=1 FL=1
MTLYMTLTQNHLGHKRIQKGKQHLNQSPALLMKIMEKMKTQEPQPLI